MPGRSGRAFALINLLVGVLFVLSTFLQLNDPDPLRWAAIWAAAAAVCFLKGRVRADRVLAAVVAAVALAWAGTLAGVLPRMSVGDLFGSMKAETPIIEESREFLGLLIIAIWMIVLAARPSHPPRVS